MTAEVSTSDSGTDATLDPAADASASADASADGSQAGGDASLWQSRFNGLNAKLGETTGQLTAEKAARAKAEADLEALRSGKVTADEAAQAQVAAIQKTLDDERQARQVEAMKARFPETFEVFGDTAATFTPDVLAASEARLVGEGNEPTPRMHNEANRSGGKAPAKEETAADVEARLLSMKVPW
jgi:hypothetical protein